MIRDAVDGHHIVPKTGDRGDYADRQMLRLENRPLLDMQLYECRKIVAAGVCEPQWIKPCRRHDLTDRFSVIADDGFKIGFGDRTPNCARSPEPGGWEPARFLLAKRH